ncbi:MAG: 3-dehydroquinate synthase [Verrucomicrobia bacterium]|nr:3-dehydroquinate synthase [Verrucomicrobiota bacterium]
MSRIVHVDLDERSYDIHIGAGGEIASLREGAAGQRALIVTDTNVDPLFGARCEAMLAGYGMQVQRAVVPAGESSKSLPVVQTLYERAVEVGLDRHATLVALGGGMVGDLAGFVAATYLRGIRFVQVPTTLLAMVDSSVGGKTGVNLAAGKNLVGAFYQPIEVVADLAMLATLPAREYASGLAEVVKYGVIWDATLFRKLEDKAEALQRRDLDVLEPIVARCCEIKAEVVAVDERDSGVRAILNFGHTLGHAIEKISGYGGLLHGEAVSLGMVFAAELSCRETGFASEDRDRLVQLLGAVGLPVLPGERGVRADWAALREAMRTDKKSRGQVPRFVLAQKLGAVVYDHAVAEDVAEQAFAAAFGGGA